MSKHTKVEYQILAGWATINYNVNSLHQFCAWLISDNNFKSNEIREDYTIIKEVFYKARYVRKEEIITQLNIISEMLNKFCRKGISCGLLTSEEVESLLKKYGFRYSRH